MSDLAEWPQPGDEAYVVRPYPGSRVGASVTRTTVAKLTARDVVLANGVRFRRERVRGGMADLPSRGTWEPTDTVYGQGHPDVARYQRENEIERVARALERAATELAGQARTPYGDGLTVAGFKAVRDAFDQMVAVREKYGLPTPAADGA